jgi:hypothetical protein
MATLASRNAPVESTRFFTIMAFVMGLTIVGAFSMQLALGRSSFAVPWQYHVHGVIFMGWIGLYLAQAVTIATGNRALHARLGKLAYAYVPLMLVAGTVIMVTVARINGGPFFFAVNEFLISNLAVLYCFGGLAFWALRVRRHTGWHRRLMLCAMAILTGPGLGRILPLPLMLPPCLDDLDRRDLDFPCHRHHRRPAPRGPGASGLLVGLWRLCRGVRGVDAARLFADRLCADRMGDRRHARRGTPDGGLPAARFQHVGATLFARKS